MHASAVVYYNSPIGLLKIRCNAQQLLGIAFVEEKDMAESANRVAQKVLEQLKAYFSGERETFDLPVGFEGTSFQNKIWRAVEQVPFGRTATYKEIAVVAGNAKAARAVGLANRNNPIPIVVPCHRIIGSDGGLTGYAGGLWRKEWLLRHEKEQVKNR